MVIENNIPKTETVYELKEKEYEVIKSPLSKDARKKVIRMYASNYLSERGKEGYGPMPIEDALIIAGSQTIINKIRCDFPKVAELLE